MAAAPLAQPARDVLRPLPRAAIPPDRCVAVGATRWWITGVTDCHVQQGAGDPSATSVEPVRHQVARRGDEAILLGVVVERLDDALPGWRQGPGRATRPADVVGWRANAAGSGGPPIGRIDLLGFCSDRWQARLESGRWLHAHLDGRLLGADELDRYGRGGGIVLAVTDRSWRPRTITKANPSPGPPQLFDGPHSAWIAAVRNCRTVLVQLGLAAGVACQLPRVEIDLDEIEAVRALLEHLQTWWHPAFGSHVDVVDAIAAGLGNLRFSDPTHVATAHLVLDRVVGLVTRLGVQSAPVVFS